MKPTYEELEALIEFQKNERVDLMQALTEEREWNAHLSKDNQQMVERLSRTEDHLRTLADYAGSVGYDEIDNPPPDPFPDLEPVAKPTRKRKPKG